MKTLIALIMSIIALAGCDTDASVASHNLSKAADNFEVARRIVFYNGISGEYMLMITGLCSLDSTALGRNAVTVTCKVAPGMYKKHFLGLSDNVTFFAEQIEPSATSVSQYRVVFKPSVIIPDVEMK